MKESTYKSYDELPLFISCSCKCCFELFMGISIGCSFDFLR